MNQSALGSSATRKLRIQVGITAASTSPFHRRDTLRTSNGNLPLGSPRFNLALLTPSKPRPTSPTTITPEIQALADGLQDDPVKIYNYVHDHIKYVLYFGSKKGAESDAAGEERQ